jgi:hypothetical protein
VVQSWPIVVLLLQVSSQPLPAAAVVLAMHRLQRLQRELAQQAGQQQQQPDQEQQQLASQVLQQLTDRLSEVRALCVVQWCAACVASGVHPAVDCFLHMCFVVSR